MKNRSMVEMKADCVCFFHLMLNRTFFKLNDE